MAPRRGGGGGGGSLRIKACSEYAFKNYYGNPYGSIIGYFVGFCFFFVVTLVTLICMFQIKKRHAHSQKLLGGIYGTSLFFNLIYLALRIISTTLLECETINGMQYQDFILSMFIFAYIARYLLLVVIFWGVNNQLRLLAGKASSFYKILSAVVLGIMGALTAGYVGLSSYNTYQSTRSFFDEPLYDEQEKLSMSFWVLYLITVIGGGALSIVAIASLRAKSLPTGGLLKWCIALTLVTFVWVLFYIVEIGASLAQHFLGDVPYQAFSWIENFFQALSWIVILFFAKSRHMREIAALTSNTSGLPDYNGDVGYGGAGGAPVLVSPPQQQYAYNQPPQPYYYQQVPGQGQQNAPAYMVQQKA